MELVTQEMMRCFLMYAVAVTAVTTFLGWLDSPNRGNDGNA
jgi:hypothetical protein